MTAVTARSRLEQLAARRWEAVAAGGAVEPELAADIAACRTHFIGLAVTEIASLRGALSGAQRG